MNYEIAPPSVATGCLMVNSFTIKNYRSFDDAAVDDCRRINILVGENGSGKTALLEALYLASNLSPELVFRTRFWRSGDNNTNFFGTPDDINLALWSDLFFKFQTNRSALISLKGKGEQTRSVEINLNARGTKKVIAPPRSRPGSPVRVEARPSIEFKWKVQGHPEFISSPFFNGSNISFPPPPSDGSVLSAFFASNQTANALEAAGKFSNLSKTYRDAEFIANFHEIFRNILDISIQLNSGAPAIFSQVAGLDQMIPVALASGGMTKLVNILVGMTGLQGGIVLVDEIENGLYYNTLPLVWKSLLNFSRKYDCQIFTSTHSLECLKAAAEVADNGNAEEFCIYQTVLENGETRVSPIVGESFVAAVAENFELR